MTAADDQTATASGTRSGRRRPLPLSGIVVVDLTVARAGPTCVRHLADWGADVIRVQPPGSEKDEEVIGRRDGSDYQNLHRNKRVISLDLKSPTGREAFLRLMKRADVLVENMRAPVKYRLKIAWDDLRTINPRLVYGSISGFGQTGPYSHRAGVDQIVQGMSGLMSVTGEPGRGPMRVGIAVSDMTAGNLLALAIMMALFERERTGEGRWVHTSLLESLIFMLDFQASRWLVEQQVPDQAGNEHPTVVPTGVFPTVDGHVNIAASSAEQWKRLCGILERPDWLHRREWATQRDRTVHRTDIHEAIAAETIKRSTAYWVDQLEGVGLPCGPIYSIDQVFSDPQVQHLGIATPVELPKFGATRLVASPLHFEGHTKPALSPAKVSGVDTASVLAWLGYDDSEIDDMKNSGVI